MVLVDLACVLYMIPIGPILASFLTRVDQLFIFRTVCALRRLRMVGLGATVVHFLTRSDKLFTSGLCVHAWALYGWNQCYQSTF